MFFSSLGMANRRLGSILLSSSAALLTAGVSLKTLDYYQEESGGGSSSSSSNALRVAAHHSALETIGQRLGWHRVHAKMRDIEAKQDLSVLNANRTIMDEIPAQKSGESAEQTDFLGKGFSSAKTFQSEWHSNWDGLEEDSKENNETFSRHIILVRHGQYYLDSGMLTRLGEEQANHTGKYLKKLLDGKTVELHSSNMPRALQTAGIISNYFNKCTVINHEEIRETLPCLSSIPGRHFKRDTAGIEANESKIMEGYNLIFKRPLKKNQPVQIWVYHANLIRFHALKALQLNHFRWLNINLHHCSISAFKVKNNGDVSLHSLGSNTHIPVEKSTYINVDKGQ